MKLIMHTRDGLASVQQVRHDDVSADEMVEMFWRAALGYGISSQDLAAAMERQVQESKEED